MPRSTAARRHVDSAPDVPVAWPPDPAHLIDALIALHHPARRQLYEVLSLGGPASVGQLAERTGLAPGSVSHHLKPLHRSGFVVPVPTLARDTRESWWRAEPRQVSWNADDFAPGTLGRETAEIAEQANLTYLQDEIRRWQAARHDLSRAWRTAAVVTDTAVMATPAQTAELGRRLTEVLTGWTDACRHDVDEHPNVRSRRAVRAIAQVFPVAPGPGR